MPTKNQCDNCRHNNGELCERQTTPTDGADCEQFTAKINLENDAQPTTENAGAAPYPDSAPYPYCDYEEQPSGESISGWLQFFLIFPVTIGSILSLIMNIASFEGGDMLWFSLTDVALGIIYFITGVFTLIAFRKRDTDAVFLAKTLVVLCFLTNLVALLGDTVDDTSQKAFGRNVGGLFWSVVWFVYLCVSAQVRRIIPKSYRKTKRRDWIIIAAAVIVPVIGMVVGFASIGSKQHAREQKEAIALAMHLDSNQCTDGRVVYTIPEGAICEEEIEDGIKAFTFSYENTGTYALVVSEYNSHSSKKTFNEYWRAWKKDSFGYGWICTETDEDTISRNGTAIFYKQGNANQILYRPIYWNFALVFHHDTGKACLVFCTSSSPTESSSMMWGIIDNMEFL